MQMCMELWKGIPDRENIMNKYREFEKYREKFCHRVLLVLRKERKISDFIYLFLAVLGLRFCAKAFSSCGKRGPLFIAVRGPLTIAASLVAEHRLQTHRLSSCGTRA